MRTQEEMQPLFDMINALSGNEQVQLWRALGERLLESGNPFEAMIKGMPKLEAAIYCLMADALSRPSPKE